MNRIFVVLLAFIFLLPGCAKQNNSNVSTQNNANTLTVDDITIFYGVSSYAMFGAEQTVIDDLFERLNSLTFEKTSDEIDLMSTFMVNFSAEGKDVKRFSVDKNGIFWLDGGTQCYKISSGSFDYEYLKKIYENSQHV
jgi:hypothetical protein